MKFNLIDTSFAHDNFTVAGKMSNFVEWDRSCNDASLPTFYTHENIFQCRTPKHLSYGILWESKAIIPQIYANVHTVAENFNKIYTFDQDLINYNPEIFKYAPCAGLWIGGSHGGGDVEIKPKNKLVSILTSDKIMCPLHQYRYSLAQLFMRDDRVDVFGAVKNDKWIPVHKTLDDYMFSIVVENTRTKNYFTEKLLNCFAVGTIPIYIGCTNIDSFFDTRGIIEADEHSNITRIVNRLSEELYKELIPYGQSNHYLCKKYNTIEDYVYKEYFSHYEKKPIEGIH